MKSYSALKFWTMPVSLLLSLILGVIVLAKMFNVEAQEPKTVKVEGTLMIGMQTRHMKEPQMFICAPIDRNTVTPE